MAFVAFSADHERQLQSLADQKKAAEQALLTDIRGLPNLAGDVSLYLTTYGQQVYDMLVRHFTVSDQAA